MDEQTRRRIQELIDLRPIHDTFSLKELMGAEWPERGRPQLGVDFKAAVEANEFQRVNWHRQRVNNAEEYRRIE